MSNADKTRRLIYGPVPSRRLGLSLGLDLVPFKTCSYDCIYCQLGKTDNKTIERKAYVPIEAILEQLSPRLKAGGPIDFITLGGSGEPTLNAHIGQLIHNVKKLTDIPVAVLTNSSLFGNPDVRQSLMEADVVLPSLDAFHDDGFQIINRPHPEITFDNMVAGLVAFKQAFSGKIWLEVFILEGVNATQAEAIACRRWMNKIDPDKVHVNTAVRPPAEAFARQVSPEGMRRFCDMIGDKAEVIASFQGTTKPATRAGLNEDLLDILSRRPCTLEDLSTALGTHINEILKHVDPMVKAGRILVSKKGAANYYQIR